MVKQNGKPMSYYDVSSSPQFLKATVGERRLWFAVLCQAVVDFQKNLSKIKASRYRKRDHERHQETAEHWLFHSDRNDIGSLIYICESCNLNPGKVRLAAKGASGKMFSKLLRKGDLCQQ